MTEDLNIKVIIIGSSGTGKTNIIKAATNKPFDDDNNTTLASSFVSKSINIDKKNIIWNYGTQPVKKNLNL